MLLLVVVVAHAAAQQQYARLGTLHSGGRNAMASPLCHPGRQGCHASCCKLQLQLTAGCWGRCQLQGCQTRQDDCTGPAELQATVRPQMCLRQHHYHNSRARCRLPQWIQSASERTAGGACPTMRVCIPAARRRDHLSECQSCRPVAQWCPSLVTAGGVVVLPDRAAPPRPRTC